MQYRRSRYFGSEWGQSQLVEAAGASVVKACTANTTALPQLASNLWTVYRGKVPSSVPSIIGGLLIGN